MVSANINEEKTKNIDIIKGEPKRAIRKLAPSIIFLRILGTIYSLVDIIWMSGLGSDALAAMGFVTPLMLIVTGISNGVDVGTSSIIVRAIGAKREDVANNAALHSLVITIIIGIIIPFMIPIMPTIITLIGGASTMSYALPYSNIMFLFMIVFLLQTTLTAILRSEGDVNRTAFIVGISTVINIILDPIFIYTLNMGMAGAAWTLVISSLISCILMAYLIWIKKDTYLDLNLHRFKPSKFLLVEIFKVAIPAGLDQIVMSAFALCINSMIMIVATVTEVAAFTVTMKIIDLATIPILGLGTALLTVSGAAYGDRNYEKMEISLSYTLKLGFLVSIILAVLLFIFAPQISLLFSFTAGTTGLSSQVTEIMSLMIFFLLSMPLGVTGNSMFQGVGRATNALLVAFVRTFVFGGILAYLLGIVLGLGDIGIYLGIIIGNLLGSMFGYEWARFFIKESKE